MGNRITGYNFSNGFAEFVFNGEIYMPFHPEIYFYNLILKIKTYVQDG